ncbi:MAG TPA: hypothetical protein VGD64_12545 [Acidisarcina sp.]
MHCDYMIQQGRLFAIVVFLSVSLVNFSYPAFGGGQSVEPQPAVQDAAENGGPPPFALPPAPKGKSSVIGGEIVSVNPVRDQFRLKVFGGKTILVLYDERTQVFRDGVRAGVLTLHPYDHASVETRLDGTRLFALRIHMLSQLPDGHVSGLMSSYNAQSGELLVAAGTHQDIKVSVPPGTPVVRVGEAVAGAQLSETFDFILGLQVDVLFKGGAKGERIATQVNLPASRGSGYVFTGNLSFLDLSSRVLMVANTRDHRTYEIGFDPVRFPVVTALHEGSDVRVATTFDGTRFMANDIVAEPRPTETTHP